MVIIDVEIALGLDLEVEERVAGDLVQPVIEEADAGRDLGLARAIEIDLDPVSVILRSTMACRISSQRGTSPWAVSRRKQSNNGVALSSATRIGFLRSP